MLVLGNASKVGVRFPLLKQVACKYTVMYTVPFDSPDVTDISPLLIFANGVDEWRVGHEMGPLQMRLTESWLAARHRSGSLSIARGNAKTLLGKKVGRATKTTATTTDEYRHNTAKRHNYG